MKIFYTHRAIDDLKRVHDFICKNNSKAACETAEKLREAIIRLSDFPMIGREVKNSENYVSIRDLITGNYIVRYAILHTEILILRIWHGKEDRISRDDNRVSKEKFSKAIS